MTRTKLTVEERQGYIAAWLRDRGHTEAAETLTQYSGYVTFGEERTYTQVTVNVRVTYDGEVVVTINADGNNHDLIHSLAHHNNLGDANRFAADLLTYAAWLPEGETMAERMAREEAERKVRAGLLRQYLLERDCVGCDHDPAIMADMVLTKLISVRGLRGAARTALRGKEGQWMLGLPTTPMAIRVYPNGDYTSEIEIPKALVTVEHHLEPAKPVDTTDRGLGGG